VKFKIDFNSPFILTFSFIATVIFILNGITDGALTPFIVLMPDFSFSSFSDYVSLFGYTLGHANLEHLLGNLMLLLLIGPILEEKYGQKNLLIMWLITSIVTAIISLIFFHQAILGASGFVFMCIVLVSFTNMRQGTIPLTFLLVVGLYLGNEVYNSFNDDNISQFGHITGGICGSIFGFYKRR
jgi:membrane associated rhomboid family serine protease